MEKQEKDLLALRTSSSSQENEACQTAQEIGSSQQTEGAPKRKRTFTTLKLQWFAERVRKIKMIKDQVDSGTYHVDSKKIAKAMLDPEIKDPEQKPD